MSIPIEQVKTPRFSMRFFRFGSGPRPLVILPGLSVQSVMGSAAAVEAEYAVMKEDFTVYLFDRRTELPPAYSVEEMAEDTAAALKALGLGKVCLFGASQGGMMGLCLAAAHPELVDRLALGSAAAKVDPEQYARIGAWAELAKKRDGVGLYLDFGEAIYPPEVFNAYRPALIMAGNAVSAEDLDRFVVLAEGTKDFDLTPRLEEIRCPVLVIGAADDRVLGPDAADGIGEGLKSNPDFQSFIYEGYGHAAFDTAPDYRERLLRFFRA